MADIKEKVVAIIVDKLGVDEAEVTPEASFTNDLGADSLDTVELIMEFEKEFNIAIPDDQAENIATVPLTNHDKANHDIAEVATCYKDGQFILKRRLEEKYGVGLQAAKTVVCRSSWHNQSQQYQYLPH